MPDRSGGAKGPAIAQQGGQKKTAFKVLRTLKDVWILEKEPCGRRVPLATSMYSIYRARFTCSQLRSDEVNEHLTEWFTLAQDILANCIQDVPTPAIVRTSSTESSIWKIGLASKPSPSFQFGASLPKHCDLVE